MRPVLLLIVAAVLTCSAVAGCGGSAVPKKELGEIVTTLPQVPGADEPYPLPERNLRPPPGAGGMPLPTPPPH